MYLRSTTKQRRSSAQVVRPCWMLVVPEDRSQEVKDLELFVALMLQSSLPPPPPGRAVAARKMTIIRTLSTVSNPTTTTSNSIRSAPVGSSRQAIIVSSKGHRLSILAEERDELVWSPEPSSRLVAPGARTAASGRDAPLGMGDLKVVDVETGPTRKEEPEGERRDASKAEETEAAMRFEDVYTKDFTRRCGPKFKVIEEPVIHVGKPVIQKPSRVSALFSTSSEDATTNVENDPSLPVQHLATRPPLPQSQSLSFLFTLGISRRLIDPPRSRSGSLPSEFQSTSTKDKEAELRVVVANSQGGNGSSELKKITVAAGSGELSTASKPSNIEQDTSQYEEPQESTRTPTSCSPDEHTPTLSLSRTNSYSSIGSDYIPLDPITPHLLKPTSKRRQVEFTPPSRSPPPPPLPYDDWELKRSNAKRTVRIGTGRGRKGLGLKVVGEEMGKRRRW
ncbi:hypothetical protein BDY24DRAFT_3689 [Mrakia frigida]|uniref:uncharacterized protein n=1 Tax=Mrakia frigida TaxID=29902 RepID=UPI003FCC106F